MTLINAFLSRKNMFLEMFRNKAYGARGSLIHFADSNFADI